MGIKQLAAFTGVILVLSGIALAALPFVWPDMLLKLAGEARGHEIPGALVRLPIESGLAMVVIGSSLLTFALIAAGNKR